MKKEKGMVLLTVLLFLVMITMLVLAMLNTSLLETKMSSNYLEKMKLFYVAEDKLKQSEQELLANGSSLDAEMIEQICGADFYRIIVNATDDNGGTLKLQSTVAKIGDVSKCDPKPKVQSGRQSVLF